MGLDVSSAAFGASAFSPLDTAHGTAVHVTKEK